MIEYTRTASFNNIAFNMSIKSTYVQKNFIPGYI